MIKQALTVYHTIKWRDALVSTYGYQDASYSDDMCSEILAPSMIVTNWILRKRFMVSLPFSDEAGPILNSEDHKIVSKYFYYLDNIFERGRLDYIELKGVHQSFKEEAIRHGFVEYYENYSIRIDLSQAEEEIISGYHMNIKRNLKKGRVSGVEVVTDDGSLLDKFYTMHQLTMKRLGTPPHKKLFFTNIKDKLKDNVIFFYALKNKEPISAIVVFLDESKYCARYVAGVTDLRFRSVSSNTLLFDEAIKMSKRLGFCYFDFGVSRSNTSVWEFKRKWTRSVPLKVNYLVKGKRNNYIDPRNESIVTFSNIWQKWVPLFVANSVGPYIRGQIGR